jgi:multicomponent Na+:H+ antiporter subunit B
MKWVYIAAGIALFVKFLIMPNPAPDLSFSIVQALVQDSGVPNAVTAVILRNRLYDTIFEVVVFTIAVMGAKFLLADESRSARSISSPINPRLLWRVWEQPLPRWWVSNWRFGGI